MPEGPLRVTAEVSIQVPARTGITVALPLHPASTRRENCDRTRFAAVSKTAKGEKMRNLP